MPYLLFLKKRENLQYCNNYFKIIYSKPVYNNHSKIDKTKILMTNGSLLKVESIADAPYGAFCNTFDLH